MIGTAGLKDLRVDCIVGIYDHERAAPQSVLMDIDLDYDFAPAAESDAIGDAVNYDTVANSVAALAERRAFKLIESMAEETAAITAEPMAIPFVSALVVLPTASRSARIWRARL